MFPWNTLFSSHKNQTDFLKNFQHNDVQSFIEKIFAEVMPENLHESMNQKAPFSKNETYPLKAQVLETHTFIYIRIPIENEDWLKIMKIFHTSNQSIIHDIPNKHDKHIITLPALVRKKGATVQYRDHILEIRLQKQTDMQFSEIDVSEL